MVGPEAEVSVLAGLPTQKEQAVPAAKANPKEPESSSQPAAKKSKYFADDSQPR